MNVEEEDRQDMDSKNATEQQRRRTNQRCTNNILSYLYTGHNIRGTHTRTPTYFNQDTHHYYREVCRRYSSSNRQQ